MQGSLSEEQWFLKETADRLARDLGVRPGGDAEALDAARAWSVLVDAGFVGIAVPEDRGGSGSGTLDVALVLDALGSTLVPAPFLGSAVLAGSLLAAGGASDALVAPIARGATTATCVFTGDLSTVAVAGGNRRGVAFDAGATPGPVVALHPEGGRLLVRDFGAFADARRIDALDVVRAFYDVDLGDLDAFDVVGVLEPDARDAWRARALVWVAAEMLGVMTGALDLAVQYAKDRVQFGRRIGTFQAVQHMLAEAHTSAEAARSAVYGAADAVDNLGVAPGLHAARVAKAYVGGVVREVIETSLQVHGGIGMTWEFVGHHYLRRGLSDAALLGDAHAQRYELAAQLLTAARS